MKSYTRESGFTLIELLVVLLIVGILGTLVAMTYSGVQMKDRNRERQADVSTLKSHLETYYAVHSAYPTLANLNDAKWRATNMKELQTAAMTDPSWSKDLKTCAGTEATPATVKMVLVTSSPAVKCYSYEVRATDGAACDNDKSTCAQYTLTATLEGGGQFTKSSLN